MTDTFDLTFPDGHQIDTVVTCLGTSLPEVHLRTLRAPESWAALPAEHARSIVDALKDAADRHWRIDPRRSVDLAEVILAIGHARGDTWVRALGTMAKGDAIKFIDSQEQAWNLLEEASRLFKLAGDDVGWGRTWIGRLSVAAQLSRVPEAVEQAKVARDIFTQHGETLRTFRVEMALGNTYSWQGDHRKALGFYQAALATATALGEQGQYELCAIYNSIGVDSIEIGELQDALHAFEKARDLAILHKEKVAEAICRNNIAKTLSRQGHLRDALKLFVDPRTLDSAILPVDGRAQLERIECLLALNRYEEARDVCLKSEAELAHIQAYLYAARISLYLAIAQAYLNNIPAAHALLMDAERVFTQSEATGLAMLAKLRRSQIALLQKQWQVALSNAELSATYFSVEQQHHNHAEALLVQAQAMVALGEGEQSRRIAQTVASIAQEHGLPALRYGAHALLGQVAELDGKPARALRHYRAAVSVIRHLRRDLTLTLRPNFMLDKLQPLRSIFRIHLQQGEWADAFAAVEMERAQTVLGYLTGRERLRWSNVDAHSRYLVEEITRLRETHYDLYTRIHDTVANTSAVERAQWQGQLAAVERQMRNITEQLYLHAPPASNPTAIEAIGLSDMQANLSEGEVLISYYNDGEHLHAFSLDRYGLEYHPLAIDGPRLEGLLGQLERNLSRALAHPSQGANLRAPAMHILQQLDQALIQPLRHRIKGHARLFVVPYGPLHFLPFNLFHDGQKYLMHSTGVAEITSVRIAVPKSNQLSPPASFAAQSGIIAFVEDKTYFLEIGFDHEVKGYSHSFMPMLPLAFKW